MDHVRILLDTQGALHKDNHPSYEDAPGEEIKQRMDTFMIGHGLYSVIDAFPFQHPDVLEDAVSIPIAERLFGQRRSNRL